MIIELLLALIEENPYQLTSLLMNPFKDIALDWRKMRVPDLKVALST